MFEITMNDTVYQFKFGIGFAREINKKYQVPIDGMPGTKEEVGLATYIGKIVGGDVLALVTVLEAANRNMDPRVTSKTIEEYIEDESTDIDKLFEEVIGFFETSNATKKTAIQVKAEFEKDQEQ